MTVEGVSNVNRATADNVSASARLASLPPSSASTPTRISTQPVPEEGGSSGKTSIPGGGDVVSLSTNPKTGAAGAANDSSSASPADSSGAAARPAESEEELQAIAEALSEQVEPLVVRLERDEETGMNLFQFVDKESGEIVRQIPPKDMVEFLKRFQSISGVFFSEQA